MTSNMNPTNLMDEIAALDDLSEHATRTTRFDGATGLYVVENRATGEVVGRYETYREARNAR